ncbi:IclR family transcriptional regulator [Georgenia deserti]|uniref:IclR family transcriptional regulator n=1 Tax=Georgenia deserti TaxID=2093781 RepID=A0ABW4L5D0_9MICO
MVPTPTASPEAAPRRSSLERVHRLFSSFDYEHTTLSLSELSRRAGLPLSTTHRMVRELLDLGMLERTDSDDLCIGVDLWKFGLLTPKTFGIQRVALPFMQDLYATTGMPVHLGIPENGKVTIVESLRRRGSDGNGTRGSRRERPYIGQRDTMHSSAVGMALLAFAESDEQEQYLADLARRPADDPPEEIRREMAQARASGYSVSCRRTRPSIAVGAPVLNRLGRPVGSLSLVLPEGTVIHGYGHLVRSTARAVQRTAWEQGMG